MIEKNVFIPSVYFSHCSSSYTQSIYNIRNHVAYPKRQESYIISMEPSIAFRSVGLTIIACKTCVTKTNQFGSLQRSICCRYIYWIVNLLLSSNCCMDTEQSISIRFCFFFQIHSFDQEFVYVIKKVISSNNMKLV